jgi:hypothetical protein
LEALLALVGSENSVAHITQAQAEALKEYDSAVTRIEAFVKKTTDLPQVNDKKSDYRKQRIVEPAKLVKSSYLETLDDVSEFVDALRDELEKAIANNERVQIR